MFLIWHTLLIVGFLGIAFLLGFKLGEKSGKISTTKIS